MRSRSHRPLVGLLLGALVLGTVVGLAWWRWGPHGWGDSSRLEQAVATAPADSERLTFTDWQGVRRALDVDLGAGAGAEELDDFLGRAFAEDLSTMSALVGSAPTMHRAFGLSPATLSWELLSQSSAGAVVTMAGSDDLDLDRLAERLEELGYRRPDREDGVWTGGPDLLSRIGPGLTPELQHLALDADAGLVRASDSAEHLAAVVGVDDSGELGDDLERVVSEVGGTGGSAPLAAAVMTGDHACGALAMSRADEDDEALADSLVDAAGRVDPYTGFAMAEAEDGRVRVAFSFTDEDRAVTNAESRAVLASGEAPGQGGSFADRFSVDLVEARDSTVVMELTPQEGAYVLSDLTSGPVLLATC